MGIITHFDGKPDSFSSRFLARIMRDFLSELLRNPNVPLGIGRVAPQRYRRKPYPASVAHKIGPAVSGLASNGVIRAADSATGSIAATTSNRASRRAGLTSLWILADGRRARNRLKALNRYLRTKPPRSLFD